MFSGTPVIDGFVPEPYEIRRYVPDVWGSMLYHANRDYLDGANAEELKKGNWTYLLRDDGSFIETFKREPAPSLVKTPTGASGNLGLGGTRSTTSNVPESRLLEPISKTRPGS